ncbi:DedA family protein [Jiangella alba]|uniref:Membrane protein DedA, SNARE-associated domain n=1 Tax=Jiangella alba TaxID=561176 RepID=A0A1H5MVT8_9ACTN|nr:DedA family protein [Jiangella alba]SEE93403.1 membrane protein DedA, SNARE-associated domain [Jiangella alba]
MNDAIIDLAREVMGSPWVYAVIFGVALLDGFFPAVPSETLVITGGVFAAADGVPNLLFVILAGAAGAFVGDHISYFIGRTAGTKLRHRATGKKSGAMFDWAERQLNERGGVILIVARYIPGGRTAVTLTCGTVEYPLRKFTFFDAIATLSWGVYSGMIGYVGGHAFEDNPLLGLGVGLGIALTITGLIELIRHRIGVRNRRRAEAESAGSAPGAEGSPDEKPQELV